ncbi:hypothetical protein KVR01_004403 [Diaporthe batatas]|uniref:uncharacterized protein n=1 Tax=Diaporthe batatas TaxID=748121 RepID=UPI001D04FAE7|nr:uncharacterized protein KVR01_004403 [Diaporthe batatas]KAG8165851.1 hypothetical protein KVR01_004403 [Diaporthe batatas]
MGDARPMDRLSHDLGNLSTSYHNARCGDGVYVELEHNKTGERFRSLDFCGGASVACFGNGGENASAEYNRVADATVAQIRKLAYVSHTTYQTNVNFDLSELLVRNANRYLVKDEGGTKWRYQDIGGDESSKMSHAIIVNSGSEAAEASIKAVWQYWGSQGKPNKRRILSRESSYHGNTLGALSLGEFPSRQDPYKGLIKPRTPAAQDSGSRISGADTRRSCLKTKTNEMHDEPLEVEYIKFDRYYPFGDKLDTESEDEYVGRLMNNLEDQIKILGADTIAAIWIEPVSGAALGCQPAGPQYLAKLKQLCRRNDIILVYDEVMCGMGRTGSMHAWHHDQAQLDQARRAMNGHRHLVKDERALETVAPDIQMVGKCLAAGIMPAAGMIVNKKIAEGLGPKFIHSFTYQSHPAVCAAAFATQMEIQRLLEIGHIQKIGERLEREIRHNFSGLSNVTDIRGRGLFWGVELQHDDGGAWAHEVSAELAAFGEEDYFVRNDACVRFYAAPAWRLRRHEGPERKGDHIMLSPAYTLTEKEVVEGVSRIKNVIQRYFDDSVQISYHRAKEARGAFIA